jgi:hypothetical protein
LNASDRAFFYYALLARQRSLLAVQAGKIDAAIGLRNGRHIAEWRIFATLGE